MGKDRWKTQPPDTLGKKTSAAPQKLKYMHIILTILRSFIMNQKFLFTDN